MSAGSEQQATGAVAVNGVRLTYREAGHPSGEPVLLLHGSGSDASTWDDAMRRLSSAGYRCLAVNLRGHATSTRSVDCGLGHLRDDVVGLIDAFGLDGVTVIGHSVGGHAALAAAALRPGQVRRLVLEDLAAPPRTPLRITLRGLAMGVVAAADLLLRPRDVDLMALASILRQLSRPDPAWWERLGGIRCPVLLLSGGPQSCIPPARLTEAAAAMPDCRLVMIPVGHRIHSLARDAFADEVFAFLGADSGWRAPSGALDAHRFVPRPARA